MNEHPGFWLFLVEPHKSRASIPLLCPEAEGRLSPHAHCLLFQYSAKLWVGASLLSLNPTLSHTLPFAMREIRGRESLSSGANISFTGSLSHRLKQQMPVMLWKMKISECYQQGWRCWSYSIPHYTCLLNSRLNLGWIVYSSLTLSFFCHIWLMKAGWIEYFISL